MKKYRFVGSLAILITYIIGTNISALFLSNIGIARLNSTNEPEPVMKILWDYEFIDSSIYSFDISPDGSFCAAKDNTHIYLFNRSGLLWTKECNGYDVRVDNTGNVYVEDVDKIYVFNKFGENIKRYKAGGSGAVITAWDIDRNGSYVAVGWEDGLTHSLDILRCSNDVEFPWLPIKSLTFSSDIIIEIIEFSDDGTRILVGGSYNEYEICMIDINGNKLWNSTENYEFTNLHPSGKYVLIRSGRSLRLLEDGKEVWRIYPENLTGDNTTDSFDYAYLSTDYLIITRPIINIIEFKKNPRKVIWSHLTAVADREAMMGPYGNYGVFYLYSQNILCFINIQKKKIAWTVDSATPQDIKLSEYSTFILIKYISNGKDHLRLIASYPDVKIVFNPYLQKNGNLYVCEYTNFSFVSCCVAPSVTIYWKADDEMFRPYTTPFEISYLEDGIHTLYYYCKDYYGLESNIKNVTVVLDKTSPTLEILEPKENQILPSKFRLKVSTVDDGVGLKDIRWKLNDGDWNYIVNQSTFVEVSVEGRHNIIISARDYFNHTTTKNISVYVDISAPTVKIIKPTDGENLKNRVEVVWEGLDNIGISKYEIRIDSGEWIDVGLNTSYEIELAEGPHEVTVRVTDFAGNQNSSTVKFNVVGSFPILLSIALICTVCALVAILFKFFRAKKQR